MTSDGFNILDAMKIVKAVRDKNLEFRIQIPGRGWEKIQKSHTVDILQAVSDGQGTEIRVGLFLEKSF